MNTGNRSTSMSLQGLVFDVDGTLADTEMAHMAAFNQAFAELGLDWHWDVVLYTQLLEVSGGKERIRHFADHTKPREWMILTPKGRDDLVKRLHESKTRAYEEAVHAGQVPMREGVLELIEDARREGLRLAIATTTSTANIEALLGRALGSQWRLGFDVVEDASTAPTKKPHPQVYLQALQRLGLTGQQCWAIEDSNNGVQAACAARMPVLVTPNVFTVKHNLGAAHRVIPSLQGISVYTLRAWHAQAIS